MDIKLGFCHVFRMANTFCAAADHGNQSQMSDYTANWSVGNRDVYLRRHSSQFSMQKAATFFRGSEEKAFL